MKHMFKSLTLQIDRMPHKNVVTLELEEYCSHELSTPNLIFTFYSIANLYFFFQGLSLPFQKSTVLRHIYQLSSKGK